MDGRKKNNKYSSANQLAQYTTERYPIPVNHLILPKDEIKEFFTDYCFDSYFLKQAISFIVNNFQSNIYEGLKDPHKFGDIVNILTWNLFSSLDLSITDFDKQLIVLVGNNRITDVKQIAVLKGQKLTFNDKSVDIPSLLGTTLITIEVNGYYHIDKSSVRHELINDLLTYTDLNTTSDFINQLSFILKNK